ncbi:hypothetical protein DNTS_031919 [Danionella cerebrum]|uniref:Store-operated calcium entry-associated regulatory factor n=1 Tax=Danionella cerebrum TaxID=2873325 RepID=A0A553Q758_9TELE|nr:hypothetical protein DNTS_031919 [Danionella translucida]
MNSGGVLLLHVFLLAVPLTSCWNDGSDAVLLRDVQVLTLYRGRYTAARRSSAVPQLQCVGGSAGCGSFQPEVVQCYNRGMDGIDTQWECKADMDNSYRFGRVEVSCEGYTSPNDAYVLRGSCGLEYTLDLTAEGKQQHSHDSWGSSGFFSNKKQNQRAGSYQNGPSEEGLGGLVVVAFLLLVAFAVYKMFLCTPSHGPQDGDASRGNSGAWGSNPGTGPPPPGFKPDYYSAHQSSSGPGYGFSEEFTRPQGSWNGFNAGHRPGGSGGFWTGMGTGGVLGYLFGSQRRQPPMGFTGSSYSSSGYSSSPSPAPNTSTGTRTASGFGGTKRR